MASRFRPRPDMDPAVACREAGWVSWDSFYDPFVHPTGKSFERAALDAKKQGSSGNVRGIGLVADVSENMAGDRFFLPIPLSRGVTVEYVSDVDAFGEELRDFDTL